MSRIIVIDAPAVPRSSVSKRRGDDAADGGVIGETDETRSGYALTVRIVRFDDKGMRVRIELTQHGGFVHHMDITTELAAKVLPLLQKAAQLGGAVEMINTAEWWNNCTLVEMREKLRALPISELESVIRRLNDVSSVSYASAQASHSTLDKASFAATQARRRIAKEVLHERVVRRTGDRTGNDLRKLLRAVGSVLRERFSADDVDAIFNEAKERVQFPDDAETEVP